MEKMLKLIRSSVVKNAIYYIANYLLRIVYVLVSLAPVDADKVVFINFNGKGFGDNPKYVANELLKGDRSLKICWMVNSSRYYMPDGVYQTKLYSLKGMYEFATARVWVSNARLPLFLKKKKSQKYFQLWHGGCGPKKIEGAAEETLIRWYKSSAKNDSKMADYFVSNSDFNTDIIKKYFWYDGKAEILKYGSPRHDPFFADKSANKKKVSDVLHIEEDSKIILYAPTFRNNKKVDIYRWNYLELTDAFEKRFGGKWTFVLRLHPNINFLDNEFEYSQRIVNGSQYEDMQELISAAEIVITDYSGVMMQAALARKKVMLYLPDKKDYLEERGLCIDLNNSPFFLSNSYESMKNTAETGDFSDYEERLEAFLKDFGFYDDGFASRRVADKIMESLPI